MVYVCIVSLNNCPAMLPKTDLILVQICPVCRFGSNDVGGAKLLLSTHSDSTGLEWIDYLRHPLRLAAHDVGSRGAFFIHFCVRLWNSILFL
jgi:hypothetical protein